MAKSSPPPPRAVWTYAYQVVPPQPESRMREIKRLLDREQKEAARAARTWRTRLLLEPHVTHILVVTDSPENDRDFTERLERALAELDAGFSRTIPLQLDEAPDEIEYGPE